MLIKSIEINQDIYSVYFGEVYTGYTLVKNDNYINVLNFKTKKAVDKFLNQLIELSQEQAI